MDLFGDVQKIKKIKGDSRSNRSELKMIIRDTNCYDALEKMPEDSEVVSFISKGLSDAGSFLFAFYKIEGVIEEATIATWTISKNNVQKLLDYVDEGKVLKLNVIINDGLLKTNSTKPIYAFMRLEFDKRKDKIQYSVANSHAKIQMYKSKNKYVTISGSGNWSENPRIENYILIGGKFTYDFNVEWIKQIINE
jgi:hypothetical protein